jgi:hypothetical protein
LSAAAPRLRRPVVSPTGSSSLAAARTARFDASQFAGVISGFDLIDEIVPYSLGFGLSSSAMSWMRETSGAPGVEKGGTILTLLGQYGANFTQGTDGHGGTLIINLPASGSVVQTPLVQHHQG